MASNPSQNKWKRTSSLNKTSESGPRYPHPLVKEVFSDFMDTSIDDEELAQVFDSFQNFIENPKPKMSISELIVFLEKHYAEKQE